MTRLLTIPEVAAALRCGRTSVYELISAGELPATDVAVKGRPKTRVTEAAVNAFIEKRTRQAPKRRAS